MCVCVSTYFCYVNAVSSGGHPLCLAPVPGTTAAAAATIAVTVTAQRSSSGATRRTGSVGTARPPTSVVTAGPSRGHLHPDARSAASRSVQRAARVLGVPFVLELDEGETGRVAGHPDVAQRTVLAEGAFDLMLRGGRTEVADVHLAGQVPLAVTGHCLLLFRMFNGVGS